MLKSLARSDARMLRDFFSQAAYGPELILRDPVLRDLKVRRAGPVPRLFESEREPSTANLLLAWFYLGEPAGREAVERLIPPEILALLLETGMLIHCGGEWAPTIMLTPQDRFLFASDNATRWQSHASDVVIWPNPTSQLLDRFTIRRPAGAALDLGAGCGIQAILAAQHCRDVTATDLNPRAQEFTRFNAWLNGVENVECLTGDTFAPVENRRFDLILANLPFFVTPSCDRLYCENRMNLDGYCRRTVQDAAMHLNEDGWAQMTLEWVEVRDQAWQERLQEWVSGIGCDVLVLHSYMRPAYAYARERIEQGPAGVADAETLARWLDHYAQSGVERIHGGVMALRRRSASNWFRIEEMPPGASQAFGDSVLSLFACTDFMRSSAADSDLLAAHLRLAPEARLEEQSQMAGGRWERTGLTLRLTSGLMGSIRIDRLVADLLVRLNGRQSFADVIASFAPSVPADRRTVLSDCLAVARRLIERRFLVPG